MGTWWRSSVRTTSIEYRDQGLYVDVSMFDGLLSWMSASVGMTFAAGR